VQTVSEVATYRGPPGNKALWKDPIGYQGCVACIGLVQTIFMIRVLRYWWVELPDGGFRPQADMMDVLVMCIGNPRLAIVMLLHIGFQVCAEMTRIVSLRYVTGMTLFVCHVFNVMVMWICGKAYWLLGIVPFLKEPWGPTSWLMIPAIAIVSYGMLMFQTSAVNPLEIWRVLNSSKEVAFPFDSQYYDKLLFTAKEEKALQDEMSDEEGHERRIEDELSFAGTASRAWVHADRPHVEIPVGVSASPLAATPKTAKVHFEQVIRSDTQIAEDLTSAGTAYG